MKNFVNAKYLIENIDAENLIILDATANLAEPLQGIDSYKKGHVKGAYFVSLEDVSTGQISIHGGRHPLPNLKEFRDYMRSLGVDNSSKIIIYDDGKLAMAGRLWWIFKYIGKDQVYILKGGKEAFIKEGGDISKEAPKVKKTGDLNININEEIIAHMQEVDRKRKDKDIAIVDVRNHKRYIGEIEPLDTVAGHIEGAINYPWTDLLEDERDINLKKIEEELKDLKDYKEVVVHCGSGITGTVTVLFLDEIGVYAKLYAGGYSDWISYEENEVIQGEN